MSTLLGVEEEEDGWMGGWLARWLAGWLAGWLDRQLIFNAQSTMTVISGRKKNKKKKKKKDKKEEEKEEEKEEKAATVAMKGLTRSISVGL